MPLAVLNVRTSTARVARFQSLQERRTSLEPPMSVMLAPASREARYDFRLATATSCSPQMGAFK